MSLTSVLDSVLESTAALASVSASLTTVDDSALLANQARLAEARRRIDAAVAVSSAEVARRSHRDLGHAGLAQRLGDRTPEKLVQRVSGVNRGEAGRLVKVGVMMAAEPAHLRSVGDAVAAGALSVDAAEAIRAGLGEPSETATAAALAEAAMSLVAEAASLPVEQLAARARELRDVVDEAGTADRERQRYEQRFLRLTPQADGMVRVNGLLDPESAALVTDAFDIITSPRRGGPRFQSPVELARARALEEDPRTTEQIMLDALVEIVHVASTADTGTGAGTLFGSRRPAVRVLVAERDLARRTGTGHLEGQTAAVSIATVERHICDGGLVPIEFSTRGDILSLGLRQRLFSSRQRVALAARDGGCMFTGCDRPPAWTEAHHIIPWDDGGPTDIDNAILLCKFHHLLVHNNGWAITRDGADLYLQPPATVDPDRTPIALPSKSTALKRLLTG
jgi:hypothetical protein